MDLSVIPLQPVASQTLVVQLGAQSCRLNVYQRRTGLFVDLLVLDVPIVQGVLGLNDVFIVREAYLEFAGDLYFHDTQGTDDPQYMGLGSRWVLLWTGG